MNSDVPPITSASASSIEELEVVNVAKLVEARKQDIYEFLTVLAERRKNNRSFQKLPNHQRRRAMSHNPFRVPKRYRLPIVIDLLAAENPKKKKGKIKWRKDLRLRRFGEHKWLSTHIFHAKRFKMTNLWGFKLALTPTLKCQRKVYHSLTSSDGCLIYDKSYYSIFTNFDMPGISPFKQFNKRVPALIRDKNGNLIAPIHIMKSSSTDSIALSIHPTAKQHALNNIENVVKNSTKLVEAKDISHFELLGFKSLEILCNALNLFKFKENDYFTDFNCKLPKNSANGTIFFLKAVVPSSSFKKFDSTDSEDLIRKLRKSPNVLTKTKKNFFPQSVLEKEKNKLENPNENLTKNEYEKEEICLDVVLISRFLISSFKPYKRISGFDILIPTQISRLYKLGGIPIGLEERRKIYLELGQLVFPEDFPETAAGYQYHSLKDEERVKKYLSLNKKCKPNYEKLNVIEPLSIVNLMSLLSSKHNNLLRDNFIHCTLTATKRGIPREMCRVYRVERGSNTEFKEVGLVISGGNTFTKCKGFAKCLILRDTNLKGCIFMGKNINSTHMFPVTLEVVNYNTFID